jgi:hypothetical protein
MEAQVLVQVSLMIDKMGIDIGSIQGKDDKEVGLKLISLLIKNLHKAETELYELVASKNGVSIEEAKKVNIIKFFKELMQVEGMKDFFS